jgi:hypothetical protein
LQQIEAEARNRIRIEAPQPGLPFRTARFAAQIRSDGSATITIDTSVGEGVPGEHVVHFDGGNDVGLVEFRPGGARRPSLCDREHQRGYD